MTKEMNEKNDKYLGADKAAEVCSIWSREAADQMVRIIDRCELTNKILATSKRISGNASLASRAGFAAEDVHAETMTLDAISKGKTIEAYTDRTPGTPLSGNNSVNDIVVTKDGQLVQGAQLKYFKDGTKTANEFRAYGKDGKPHYKETDAMVGPADQLQDIKDAARKTELLNEGRRPGVAEAARDVQAKASDRLQCDGAESRPLTKKEAELIAKGGEEGKELHQKIQNHYKNVSTLRQMGKAAVGGAAISTVIAGTINTVNCLRLVKEGKMTHGEAVKYILTNTAIAATDSAVKAAGATGAVSLAARAMPSLFKGSMLKAGLAAGAVGGVAVCAVDVVECLVAVAAGKMTWSEMESRTGKNIIQVGAGVAGATIGGAIAGPVGALVGGLITSVAATVAIENFIEKPFFETMENTRTLVDTERLMCIAIEYLSKAGVTMEEFKAWLIFSEQDFAANMAQTRLQREANRKLINNL